MEESKILNNRYKILSSIGKGGMAVVYKAFDTEIQRNVAIKVMRTDRQLSASALKRFDREAKFLAKLDHPNIVKLFDYGESDGTPYLVMELVDGESLKAKMDQVYSIQEAAKTLEPVARALAYAHDHGVIHRDIKPSNILVTSKGELKVSDFGIAKLAESEMTMDLTGTNVSIGTPEYMSPEQGLGKPVDGRTDMYSLGLILYEMVTGKKPFTADTPLGLLHSHITDEVTKPSIVEKRFPATLDAVILKALEKEPMKRYPSMKQFADVLEGIHSGQKQGKIIRMVGTNRKSKALLWVGIPIILALSTVFILRDRLLPGILSTPTVTTTMVQASPVPATQVTTFVQPTETSQSAQPSATAGEISNAFQFGGAPVTIGNTGITLENTTSLTKNLEGQFGSISNIEITPNNQYLLASSVTIIKVLDSKTLENVGEMSVGKRISSFKVSPDGKEVAILCDDNSITFWDVEKNKKSRDLTTISDPPTSLDYSENGEVLAVGTDNGTIYLLNADTKSVIRKITDLKKSVTLIRISPDASILAAGSEDQSVRVWNANTGESIVKLWDFSDAITALALSPDSRYLVVAPNYYKFNLYDLSTGKLIQTYDGHSNLVSTLEFSPDGKFIFSGSSDKKIRVWSVDSPYPLVGFQEHLSKVVKVMMDAEGKILYSASQDGKINFFSIKD